MIDRDISEPFRPWLSPYAGALRRCGGRMIHTYLPSELGSLWARLGVGAPVDPELRHPLCLVASITNLRQIEQAHGSTCAVAVRHFISERAHALCEERRGNATASGEHILFVFDVLSELPYTDPLYNSLTASLLDRVLSALGDRTIPTGSGIVFPTISVKVVNFRDEPFDIVSAGATRMLHGQPGDAWRRQFVEDTEVAESIFGAIDGGRLQFHFEPVCHANQPSLVDYFEALLCESMAGTNTRVRVGSLVPALERLGLVRRLDRWVVESIIGMLRDDPHARLGCNISAQSATLDAWWAFTLTVLSEQPDIARRFTIEITETAPMTELGEVQEFVRVLRFLGCRVALDDVGGGYCSLTSLLYLDMDIAKIDASFVRAARLADNGPVRLRHIVALAKTCATVVVAEGIESEVDARIARESGVTCLQGHLYSKDVALSYGRFNSGGKDR
jgi:EAL domain-containing protein (putative c-di-GMP-specific phosphodiesterase class I)